MRPLIVGMNNPLSERPEHALWPDPPGCTGWRLWQLLSRRVPGVTQRQYLRAFDRMNLVVGDPWSLWRARAEVTRLQDSQVLVGRTVLVLGQDVREAFGLPRMLVHPIELCRATFRQLPHPSGRNLWYNDEGNQALAATLLEELYAGSMGARPGPGGGPDGDHAGQAEDVAPPHGGVAAGASTGCEGGR